MPEYIERNAMRKALEQASINPRFADEPPTADVEPVRHGRWIWDKSGLDFKPLCSKCKKEPWRRSNRQSDLPNYCPNCGTKMDLEEQV